jgi:uncharacterized protein
MLATAYSSELDRGKASVAPGMERLCALTRKLKPVAELVRFVVGPAGKVVPDVKRNLPGRGIWISGTCAAVEEAVKCDIFARGFKRDVGVAPNLAAAVERLLERSALDALAITSKAGRVISGFTRVERAIARDDILALIHAAECAKGGRRKLDAASQRKTKAKSRKIAIVGLFSSAQLDLALNRPNVVHAALLAGPGSETFLARVARLQRFRAPNSLANAPSDGARGHITE